MESILTSLEKAIKKNIKERGSLYISQSKHNKSPLSHYEQSSKLTLNNLKVKLFNPKDKYVYGEITFKLIICFPKDQSLKFLLFSNYLQVHYLNVLHNSLIEIETEETGPIEIIKSEIISSDKLCMCLECKAPYYPSPIQLTFNE